MHITMKGSTVFSTGKIKGYTEQTLTARIREFGGGVSTSPNASVTVALIGERASQKKIDKCQALGLTCLQGDDILTFLADGEVTLAEAKGRSLDDLIGELRGLLAQTYSREGWEAICALVDQCAPEHKPQLIAYLRPQLDAWPESLIAKNENHVWFSNGSGLFDDAAGAPRYFPASWLTAVINGEQDEKFTLCTALSFSVAGLNNTLAIGVFDKPAISHITTFDVGSAQKANVKKLNFYKAMASSPHLQNVETLVLHEAPSGAFDVLAEQADLPKLRAIHMSRNMGVMSEPERGGAIFAAGPWASQLERVLIYLPEQLEAVARDRDKLPALEHVAIALYAYADAELVRGIASPLSALARKGLERVELSINMYDTYERIEGYGVLLDALADGKLKVLDVSQATELSGAQGRQFIQEHLLDNGLADTLERLIVGDRLSVELCELLTARGLEVESALSQVARAAEIAQLEAMVSAVPDAPITAASGLSVMDAMRFEAPSEEAWRVVVSVVEGLERELDAAQLEMAISQLESYLQTWPAHLRPLPVIWWGEAIKATPSPKLRLVRAFSHHVFGADEDAKQTSNLFKLLANSGNMSLLDRVDLWYLTDQKHMITAVAELLAAARPRAGVLDGSKYSNIDPMLAHLREEGLMPEDLGRPPYHEHKPSPSLDALALTHAYIELKDPAQLHELFARTDLGHMISLSLRFTFGAEAVQRFDWSSLTPAEADLSSLVHLRVYTYELPEAAHAPLATWLAKARPLSVNDPFSSMAPYDTPVLALMERGIYTRAFGSSITLPNTCDAARLRAVLGGGEVNVAGLRMMYPGRQEVTMATLVDMMPDTLKRRLRVLHWRVTPEDIAQLDAIAAQLPGLAAWSLENEALNSSTNKERKALLAALANASHAAQLAKVQLISNHQSIGKLSAAEYKLFDKGCGPSSLTLSQRKLEYLPL